MMLMPRILFQVKQGEIGGGEWAGYLKSMEAKETEAFVMRP